MKLWVDLANSPHVALFRPVVAAAEGRGWEVLLTARDHAQTVPLARRNWPGIRVFGGSSPPGRAGKARALASRVVSLHRLARRERPDVALSHGSYAQLAAARLARVPAVTMMDYEHQPANHLSFRLARCVIVPEAFPEVALRRFGAAPGGVRRYAGYKEELYLAEPSAAAGEDWRREGVLAVLRPPPTGALYHRGANERFEEVLAAAGRHPGVHAILLPRSAEQRERYERLADVEVPPPVDGAALLLAADLTVGAGGTMSRESAVLGVPTYTVFLGRLAAVDAQLIAEGRLRDLRAPGALPAFERRSELGPGADRERAAALLDLVLDTAAETAS